jgi:uncharacterized protein with GYD domain
MSHYLVRGRYTSDGWAGLVKNPHDRNVAVRPIIESLGGTYTQAWFTEDLGELVGIIELPDDQAMACLAAAVRSSDVVAELSCEKLISTADAVELFERAGSIGYQPPA